LGHACHIFLSLHPSFPDIHFYSRAGTNPKVGFECRTSLRNLKLLLLRARLFTVDYVSHLLLVLACLLLRAVARKTCLHKLYKLATMNGFNFSQCEMNF